MLIHGFTQEEWEQFSKSERRILALVHDMKYEREQICALLEITDNTLRGHIANIRRKQSRFREARAKAATLSDNARAAAVTLPEPTPEKDEAPPANDSSLVYTRRHVSGKRVTVTRNPANNLSIKELMEPLDSPPIAVSAPGPVPASPFLTIPNPTV